MNKKAKHKIQYTLRGVSDQTDRLLREKATEYGASLNETALQTLQAGLGITEECVFHELDRYAGTWVEDPVCDNVLEEMRKVDMEMWK